MTYTISLRPAIAKDYPPSCSLLESARLPVSDIRKDMQHFFIAESDNRAVGLIRLLEDHARSMNIRTLYLITDSAEIFLPEKVSNLFSGPICRRLWPLRRSLTDCARPLPAS